MVEAEQRILKLENSYSLVAAELGQIGKILSKMEASLEKQNDIMTDIRLLRQAQDEERRAKAETIKRIYADIEAERKRVYIDLEVERRRIDKIEAAKAKIAWTIIGMVILALGSLVIKGG